MNRQRIDIAADGDRRLSTRPTGDARDDPRPADSAQLACAERFQRILEPLGGAMLLVGELGVGVDLAPQCEQLLAEVAIDERVVRRDHASAVARPPSVSRRTVRSSMRSMSISTPIPTAPVGTVTMPSASIVHSGVTMSRSQ